MAAPTPASEIEQIEKEGYVRKRGGRMHRWTSRYFVLTSTKISYKLKQDVTTFRDTFDLAPGCRVTDIVEESFSTIRGKKVYVFWLVWPHDKHSKADEKAGDDSEDDEKEVAGKDKDPSHKDKEKDIEVKTDPKQSQLEQKTKDLKEIVESEQNEHRRQQHAAEVQIERHQKHDKNVSLGVKVAAVAVGGVLVGALTAGIGLVPYITVVGITAVAGGGMVAYNYRRPFDSRLIIACESMPEALAWKAAIEAQVQKLEFKPMLPPSADPHVISSIIGISAGGGGWKRHSMKEGIRIMEQDKIACGTKCMKSQLKVSSSPFSAFLALMDGHYWPKCGSTKVSSIFLC
jgi:hypothetical protein